MKSERRRKMVNIGVVGCGYWGPKHIRVCHELEKANLKSVCDLDEKRLQQVRAQYPYLNTTMDYSAFLDNDLDAVVIATPVNAHYKLAKEALLQDKHVLIEKPMTTNSREALELIEIADKRKLTLMVGHTYEYHPAVDYLKELVNSGELGDIYSIDADRLNLGLFRPDCNVIWDLAPHDISIMFTLIEDTPVTVSARGTHHIDTGVCDMAYLEIVFAGGAMGHAHVSWLHPRKVREVTIVGSQKMVVYDDISESEKVHIYDKSVAFTNGGNTNGFSGWPPNYHYGDVVIPYIANAEPLKQECNHFIKCINEGCKPKSDGWVGLKVTSVLEAADKSLANGGYREKLDLASLAVA
jgi:predicted dehydrogenase